MWKYASLLCLAVIAPVCGLPAGEPENPSGGAAIQLAAADGGAISDFKVSLYRITRIMGEKADEPGYLGVVPPEWGELSILTVAVQNVRGRAELVNLAPGHYQVSVGADGYRMESPEWRFSQVMLRKADVLRLCRTSSLEKDEGPVWTLTQHFDVAPGRTTDVTIVMLPVWTLHGVVDFPENSPPADRAKSLSRVRCRYDGPDGSAPFRLDQDGAFAVSGTKPGVLKVSFGKPVGVGDEQPWEQLFSIDVEPHGTYILPKVVVKDPLGRE